MDPSSLRFSSELMVKFEDAVKTADKLLAEKNPKLKLLSKFMISHKLKPYASFCYYYFRWVDDYIDNKFNSIEDKKKFFKNQTCLVNSFMKCENGKANYIEEYFLFYFLEFIREQNAEFLIDEFKLLLITIGEDIKRLENNGIFSEHEMQRYMNDNIRSFFRIINFFLQPKSALIYQDNFNCLRTLVCVFLINDLSEDFSLGYINLSAEELRRYQIDSSNLLDDKNLKKWFKDKFAVLNEWLEEDALVVKKFPLKLKLFWFGLFPYCVHKMNRIKIYDYNPRKDYRKNLLKESKLHLLTFLSVFKFSYKIFAPFHT